MKQALIDTDTLSLFMRSHPSVIANFAKYLQSYQSIQFSIITYYKMMSGLKHQGATKRLNAFLRFASTCSILPLTVDSVAISADIYAHLRKIGTPVDDMDLLIAGVAIANRTILVTHNSKHFSRIPQLTTEDWSL